MDEKLVDGCQLVFKKSVLGYDFLAICLHVVLLCAFSYRYFMVFLWLSYGCLNGDVWLLFVKQPWVISGYTS